MLAELKLLGCEPLIFKLERLGSVLNLTASDLQRPVELKEEAAAR